MCGKDWKTFFPMFLNPCTLSSPLTSRCFIYINVSLTLNSTPVSGVCASPRGTLEVVPVVLGLGGWRKVVSGEKGPVCPVEGGVDPRPLGGLWRSGPRDRDPVSGPTTVTSIAHPGRVGSGSLGERSGVSVETVKGRPVVRRKDLVTSRTPLGPGSTKTHSVSLY